jgi:hypothetical protein
MPTPAELAQRRVFDYRVLRDMQCAALHTEAYATTTDLARRQNPIVSEDAASRATKYRFLFRVPTLIGPGQFSSETEIGVDTEVVDYPLKPPNTWIISNHVPWSPHFKKGAPVCLGEELWEARQGHITLGHLAIHIARLLNWDEKGRGPGYVGWNGEAIAYHKQYYQGRPLNPNFVYPALPGWLTGEVDEPEFEVIRPYVAFQGPDFRLLS